MVSFSAIIKKFAKQGEKTGWTYVAIPPDIAESLKPGVKTSFRVKGKLDQYPINGIALLPMGGGSFILPLNAAMRKGTGKMQGAELQLRLEEDKAELKPPDDLLVCLRDEPEAFRFFNSLAKGHQNYFTKWINGAKTNETRAKRINHTVLAMLAGKDYGAMLRSLKAQKV